MQGWGRIALVGIITLGGCARPTTQTGYQYRAELSRLRYPADAEAGQSLDIQVVREGGHIRVVNRTPRRYEQMQLWLNRRYVQKVDELAIGTGNTYPLNRAVNRHGERFPLPGLLSPRKTQPVVLAELYDPRAQVKYKLTVQPDATEDE